jgi:tRNA(Ser,Leu) C12 N-acetylase TAN1
MRQWNLIVTIVPGPRRVRDTIPVERTFSFAPELFTAQIAEAVTPFVQHMRRGTFHVRIERRGLAGKIPTQEIERAVADHLVSLARAHAIQLETDFEAPDFVVAVETIGDQCGVAPITREISGRFPFVQAH